MSEVEKQPENAAPAKAEKKSGKGRLIVELAVLVIAVIAVCIVGEVRKLSWWCHLRAKLGSATMSYKLAENYREKDPKQAKRYLEKAAAKGHIKAMKELAETDIKWRQKLAEMGDKRAQFQMALACRREGKDKEAVVWYEKAAANGIVEAFGALGICYYDGIGVEKDVPKAKELLKKAAEKGYGPAEAKLEEIADAEKKAK